MNDSDLTVHGNKSAALFDPSTDGNVNICAGEQLFLRIHSNKPIIMMIHSQEALLTEIVCAG